MSPTSKPIVRIGFPITGAIWRNEKDGRAVYSATFQRSYKDEAGKWKRTDTFYADDLLPLAKIADTVHSEMSRLRAADRHTRSSDE